MWGHRSVRGAFATFIAANANIAAAVGSMEKLMNPAPGVQFEPAVTADALSNVSGGVDEGARGLADFGFGVNLDRNELDWWPNGRFRFLLVGTGGDSPSELAGDVQALDNIDAVETWRLLEAWYEHAFLDDRLGVLVGLYPHDTEFEVLDYAGLFLKSSFGTSPELSQVGPSIFPTSSFGGRIRYDFGNGFYGMGTVYEGVPGDPDRPHGTHISFSDGDGIFALTEVGFVEAGEQERARPYMKAGIGGWVHTATFTDFNGDEEDFNGGLYFIAERALTEKLGVFVQFGAAMSDRNQLDAYVGGGLNYFGPLPEREEDAFGVAVAHARSTDHFFDATPDLVRAETAVDFTYNIHITDHISLQPDVQFIVDPGMDPTVDDSLAIGARLTVKF